MAKILKRVARPASGRTTTVNRKTAETDIALTLAIDGRGVGKIDTGVAFFDHMLTLFAKHGLTLAGSAFWSPRSTLAFEIGHSFGS